MHIQPQIPNIKPFVLKFVCILQYIPNDIKIDDFAVHVGVLVHSQL